MLTKEEQIRLNEFVNRDGELQQFCGLLDAADHLVMILWGVDGIGKTSLLTRLVDECGRRSRRLIKVKDQSFETVSYDYLMIMRQVSDGIGDQYFRPLNDLINYFTVPDYQPKVIVELNGSIEVANSAQFINSSVGDIVGIKDLHLAPRTDKNVPEGERLTRLSAQFFADLRVAFDQLQSELQGKPLIVFIDDVEKMTKDTRDWLWTKVVRSTMDDTLTGVKFILGVRDKPNVDRYMSTITQAAELKPLDEAHIKEYVKKRGISAGAGMLEMIMAFSQGIPMVVATMVDSLHKAPQQGSPSR